MRVTRNFSRIVAGMALVYAVIDCSGSDTTAPNTPAAPSGVTAVGGDGFITIDWNTVPEATSYNVYWSTTQGFNWKEAGTPVHGVTKPFVLTGLKAAEPYYFVVTAVNSHGQTPSGEVNAAPIGLSAVGGSGLAVVSWTPSAPAASYDLYWSTTSGVTPANGTKIAGVVSPYTHTGLTNGTGYYYVVTPVIGGVEGAPMREAAAEPNEDATMPTFVRATAGNGQVTLTWAGMNCCSTPSYLVLWSTHSDMSNATTVNDVNSPFVHTGLTNGITYYYQVAAADLNGFGPGWASVIRSATPGM
jgi:hypothetical protein